MGSVFERIKSRIMKLNYKEIMKTDQNPNEKTPIVPLGDPGEMKVLNRVLKCEFIVSISTEDPLKIL